MTNEPVAYLVSQEPYTSGCYIVSEKPLQIDNKQITPLYTREQLRPSVKMTEEEKQLITTYKNNESSFASFLDKLARQRNDIAFGLSKKILFSNLSEEKIMTAWLNPEETIEIVPEKKWFVRTKEFDDGSYKVLEDIRLDYYEYGNVRNDEETSEYGHQFDTKEQAEDWTNPLTEAVLLPVEDE